MPAEPNSNGADEGGVPAGRSAVAENGTVMMRTVTLPEIVIREFAASRVTQPLEMLYGPALPIVIFRVLVL